MNVTILRFDTLNSTNNEAVEQAKRGADEGLCVVAKQQTAGKGRHGRTWISPKDAGLYFSIVLRPKIETKFLPIITLMTSVAVFEVLKEKFNLIPDIKWSNDVLVNEKKICGILAEAVETDQGLAVIVGIGINLNAQNFPVELKKISTSIEQESNIETDIEELLYSLTHFFSYFYGILKSENGTKHILEEWRKRSSYWSGKAVRVRLENEIIYGKTCGLEENGALRIQNEKGEIKIIQAGDVEQIRPNDV